MCYKRITTLLLLILVLSNHQQSQAQEGPQTGELFGNRLAVGDFDNDGFEDLIIGVMGDDDGGEISSGGLHVIYGSNTGLETLFNKFFNSTILGTTTDGWEFLGADLAVGKFNDDEFDDLAVSAPFDNELFGPGSIGHGSVHIFYGSISGLNTINHQVIYQGGSLQETPESYDQFGFALAAGDFDGDSFDDLAISAPGEDLAFEPHPTASVGVVHVLWGGIEGLTGINDFLLYQSLPQLEDTKSEYNDRFGHSLEAGDFNGDGFADLAVGSRERETFDEDPDDGILNIRTGMVEVFYGHDTGNLTLNWQQFYQGQENVFGSDYSSDMGSDLASGDINGDGYDELVVSSPRESYSSEFAWSGAVHILYGYHKGLTTGQTSQFLFQNNLDGTGVPNRATFFSGSVYDTWWNPAESQALAVGDVNGDNMAELFIGVPGDHEWGTLEKQHVGKMYMIRGDGPWVKPLDNQVWAREDLAAASPYASDDPYEIPKFGAAIILGDFNGDGCKDTAIGSPRDLLDSPDGSIYPGLVYTMYNSKVGPHCLGPVASDSEVWSQMTPGIFPGSAGDSPKDELLLPGEAPVVPDAFALSQNYPNPFNPSTEITFVLPAEQHASLVVYDLLGREVATLANEILGAGSHTVTWKAEGLPTGTYIYRLTSGSFTQARTMMLAK